MFGQCARLRHAGWSLAWLVFALGGPVRAEQHFSLPSERLASMAATIRLGIHEGDFPGAVLWFQTGSLVCHEAFGNRMVDPELQPMCEDTIFDAASLTKVMATTPAVMTLVETGKVDLDAFVADYLPPFAARGKDKVTVRHLLTHTSGLAAGIPRDPPWDGYETGLRKIRDQELGSDPGARFLYSDINFILLGELVRCVTGRPLDEYCHQKIFAPLGMVDTGFNPPEASRARVAPTTREGEQLIHGVVHDPTSRRMGGVTGHAGLFTTAEDVARYARLLLNRGELDGVRIFKPETVALMTRVHTPPEMSERRGLGWDIDTPFSHPRGDHFGEGSFGHTGWTGTSIWIDPPSDSFLIFLTNRNHPTEAGRTKESRIRLANLAAETVQSGRRYPVTVPKTVLNGVDLLAARGFRNLAGKRVGLITNHTGLAKDGKSTIDLLHESRRVDLKALFSPEHGIRGKEERSDIGNSVDEKTGLPVYSLYGNTRRPLPEQLKDLDTLVFDIQDIGCRFYTYISTMGLAMEAAAEAGLGFVVLDRINPINGVTVDGPVRQGPESFTAFHPIPVRHGMTVGELALLMREERDLDLNLRVVPIQGWRRELYQDQTDLPWIAPSPNMLHLREAILYPGIGLLEFMKLSVGRGTPAPFEQVGAPYLDGEKLTRWLEEQKLPGVTVAPVTFTPGKSVFAGERCHGVGFAIEDRGSLRSVDLGMAVARYLVEHHEKDCGYAQFATLLVHPPTFEGIRAGREREAIRETWKKDLEAFSERRRAFLLY